MKWSLLVLPHLTPYFKFASLRIWGHLHITLLTSRRHHLLPFKILIHPNPQISLLGVSLVRHSSTTIKHSMPALQTRNLWKTVRRRSKSQTLPNPRSGSVNETSSHFSPHRNHLFCSIHLELLQLISQSPFSVAPQRHSILG